ncbi:MAG TPA: hypothetical protein VK400_12600 [Pyrinomonadaceae bacterium]|nr:hypothetical protein [Pyrinomonadaceae bacterium]
MKTRPIHENLDTSFVNLSALLRYLQRRQFVGRVRVELSGYEADISLLEGNKMQVREHDLLAGRVAEGEEAMQRMLIRAREPGGTINVYQTITNAAAEAPKKEAPSEKPKPIVALASPVKAEQNGNGFPKASPNGNSGSAHQAPQTAAVTVTEPEENPPPKSAAPPLPNFPFDLTNEVEARARRVQRISPEDWQTLLQLIGELLGTIDKTLAEANLNFSGALAKVCAEIAVDYPFLNPANGIFAYGGGQATMRERTNAKLFVAGVNEALKRILEKLGASRKLSQAYRAVVQKILALVIRRKSLYEKFFITPQLEKILGV